MSGEYVMAKYIRLSMDGSQSDSMSIETQRFILDGRIEGMNLPNLRVLEFVDNGYTGTSFERPAVQELLELVQTGKVQCVVVKDFSRFGRNSIEMGYFLERVFPLFGVRFISVDDEYDSNQHEGGTGGVEVAFKLLLHEQYSKDLSRKIRASKYARMSRGEYIHSFFGYRKADGALAVDKSAAETVQRIYTLALEGKNYGQIAEVLYAEKRQTPAAHKSGGSDYLWSKSQILKILRDEQYTGVYTAGKSKTTEIGSGKQAKVDKADWIRIERHHPSIVSKDTFDAVQRKLDERSKPLRGRKISTNQRYKNQRVSPLKGKVVCGLCGHVMRLSMTKNAAFHCHYTLAAPDAACHKHRIDAMDLERRVLHILREQAAVFEPDGEAVPQPFFLQQRAELAAVEDSKQKLYEQFVVGEISRDEFKAANTKLSADMEELCRRHTAIAAGARANTTMQARGKALKEAAEVLKGRRTLTAELVIALIDKVMIFPDNRVEVNWNMTKSEGRR